MTDRPEPPPDEGGYYFGDGSPHGRAAEPPDSAPSASPDGPDGAETPTERSFRRTTPARVKPIRPERPRGWWGLVIWTTLYVMASAGSADYLPLEVRMAGHVLFWLAVVAGLLVTVVRERRNDWESTPRWPWAAAVVCGTLTVELLVATVSSLLVIIGSAIILSVALLILLILD